METLTHPVTKKMEETENGEDNGLSVTARDRISAEIRDLYKGPSHEPISIHNPKLNNDAKLSSFYRYYPCCQNFIDSEHRDVLSEYVYR